MVGLAVMQAGFGHNFNALQDPDCPLVDILPQVVDYCEMHDGFSELIPEFFFKLSKVSLNVQSSATEDTNPTNARFDAAGQALVNRCLQCNRPTSHS